MSTLPSDHTIVFAPFALDLRREQLLRGSECIPLRPKTWSVLRYLAERPNVLVPKRELLDRLWPGVAVTDDALSKCISEIRAALQDDQRNPLYVQTVHRRGFRFVGITDAPPASTKPAVPEPTLRLGFDEPFVGRAAEIDALEREFRTASHGRRRIVFLAGESGIGKSALLDAAIARLTAQGELLSAVGGSVDQQGRGEPYMPVLVALERLARGRDGDRIGALMRRFAPTWLAQIPWLTDTSSADEAVPAEIRPERMLREFCSFVEAVSADVPLLLVLEDLHWSDTPTLELLAMLAQRREPARLLVIATYRPAEISRPEHPLGALLRELQLRRQCNEIRLGCLGPGDVEQYISARFPECAEAETLARVVHAHTDGSPLFMATLLDDLVSRGCLVETEPGWALTVPLIKIELGVPETLQVGILAQLDSLSPFERELVEAASVVGTEFAVGALAGALDTTDDELERACGRLARSHRFVKPAPRGDWGGDPDAPRFAFVHSLHRQVVYESLPDGRCRDLHQAIADRIEATYTENPGDAAAALAFHFERCGDVARTIGYLNVSAQRAYHRFAAREAADHLEHAISLLPRLPDRTARLRRELELRSLLGPAWNTLYGYPSDASCENCERVLALSEEVGNLSEQYAALYAMWHSRSARAELAMVDTAERMVVVAKAIGEPEARSQAELLRGRSHFWQGNYRVSEEALQRSRELCDRPIEVRAGSILGLEPPWIAVDWYSAVTVWCLGYPDRAREFARRSLDTICEFADPYVLAGGYVHTAYAHQLARDAASAETLARRALDLVEEHGLVFWRSFATLLLGRALAQQGDLSEGLPLLRLGLAAHRESGTVVMTSHALGFIAEAYAHAGDPVAGLEAADEGLAAVRAADSVWEPELWRLRGELLATAAKHTATRRRKGGINRERDDASPEACFAGALEVARRQGAKSFELRAATSLARHARTPASVELLRTTYGWFREGFATPDLLEAKTVLDDLTSD